jgi:hypothetical protein
MRSFYRLSSWPQTVDPYLLLTWALSLFALAPLLAPGYFFNAHDGRHSVFYQVMFDASLRDGAWWPRWAMHHDQGYGYPTFVLQAPLAFYVTEVFVFLGAGFTLAVKCSWSFGLFFGAWGMYRLVLFWLEGESGDKQPGAQSGVFDPNRSATLAAALLYVYLPYRLLDAYVRAALADTFLLAWFPWVFLAFDRLLVGGSTVGWSRRLALAILALGGALLTHTFALISFAPLLVTFVLFRLGGVAWQTLGTGRYRNLWPPLGLALSAGVGALLLTAVFLVPLFVEAPQLQQKVYVSNTYDFRNHFVYWGQFFSPFWGYGYSDDPQGASDGMSFQLGLLPAIFMLLAIVLLVQQRKNSRRSLAAYLLLALAALFFLMTPRSIALWEAVPPLAVIQFPWRLLALTGFVACGLAGLAIAWAAQGAAQTEGHGGILLGVLAIVACSAYLDPPLQPVEPWREDGRAVIEFERQHPDMFGYTIWTQQAFTESPMTVDYESPDYHEEHGRTATLSRLAILRGEGKVLSHFSAGSSGGGMVEMRSAGVVRVHWTYFPGWQVRIDGKVTPYRVSPPEGLLEVDVPAGQHRIEARMGATPARRIGAIISWAVVIALAGVYNYQGLRKTSFNP